MSDVSIIGSGNMAGAIGALALGGGNTVEIISRDAAKAGALAGELGDGARTGTWGAAPAGDIVVLAVLFQTAVSVVDRFGDALDGKIIIDITNPFNDSATGLAIPHDTSVAQMIAEAAPAASWPRAARWTCSWPAMTRRPRPPCPRSSRASDCVRGTSAT
jgi:predicted dinucleotide-binding enzyme